MLNKKKVLFFTLPLLMVLLFVSIFLRFQWVKADQIVQDKENLKILLQGAKRLQELWFQADQEAQWIKESDCLSLIMSKQRTDISFLRCNPDFISCFLKEKGGLRIRSEGKNFDISIRQNEEGRPYKLVTRTLVEGAEIPAKGYLFDLFLEGEKHSLKVIVEDSCHELYVPQRTYGHGLESRSEDVWRFDLYNQNIFVDSDLVSNRDVNEWITHMKGKVKNLPNPRAKEFDAFAATDLTWDQMNRYCYFRSSEIMNSLIFDAASFHPGDLSTTSPTVLARGPYPWSRKKKDSFLYQARHGENFNFEKNFCSLTYTKECFKYDSYVNFHPYAISWVGMKNTLGGPLEALKNPHFPKRNLKASSYYFSADSSWHELGKRAYWDGQGHSFHHFSWGIEDPEGNLPDHFLVGFRCMRKVYDTH